MSTPTIGIHYDVPDAEYRAWQALSHSAFEVFIRRSPWHFRREQRRPAKPAKPEHFVRGGLVDCLLFTPDAFADLFIIAEEAPDAPINPKTGRLYGRDTKAFQEWVATQPKGREIVDAEEVRMARAMVHSVIHSPWGALLTDEDAIAQPSLCWQDQGVLCKGRLDALRIVDGTIVDFKTSNDASEESFARDIEHYGYHRQAAWYLRACNLLDIRVDAFQFVVLEKCEDEERAALADRSYTPTFAVTKYDMPEEWIAKGMTENEVALNEYCRCVQTGVWPCYRSGTITPPKWVKLEELA